MDKNAGRSLRFLHRLPISKLESAKRISPKSLSYLGLENLLDLLTYYPRRHIDRTNLLPIRLLKVGEEAVVVGNVTKVDKVRYTKRGKPYIDIEISDKTARLKTRFFNQSWRAKQMPVGTEVAVYAKVTYLGKIAMMTNPVVDILNSGKLKNTGSVVPVYKASEKANVTSSQIRAMVMELLERTQALVDPLSLFWRKKFNLIDRTKAFYWIHDPPDISKVKDAIRRLSFDELLRIQIPVCQKKIWIEQYFEAPVHVKLEESKLIKEFFESLDFEPTADQMMVIEEISKDMSRTSPMHRLVQGDVGSGKTLVAIASMLLSVESGYQAALMVPTEVLAEQHYKVLLNYLDRLSNAPIGGPRVEILTASVTEKKRGEIIAKLSAGQIDIIVGTHSLLAKEVKFKNLSLVIIDEQHRFGVDQRRILRQKSEDSLVHTLVMTATPIPRTLAMLFYGDLEKSYIKQMPKGRAPVITELIDSKEDLSKCYEQIIKEVKKGHRAYVVCPAVEESDKTDIKSVVNAADELKKGPLKDLRIDYLHGQMKQGEKDKKMSDFLNGDIEVLVSTTVIEVGIDVKNATVMMILDADRFGISQLHQLRGRVGRSHLQSYCYLVSFNPGNDARIRLEALVKTNNGFELAEIDLFLRGEGTVLDVHQQGRSDLKLASLIKDADLIEMAKKVAEDITDKDPRLTETGNRLLAEEIEDILTPERLDFLFQN
jgi:ATP-dependent DNA helicase RecG